MLSNHLIGNYKFVLFVDNVGLERNSKSLLEKLLKEQNVKFEFYNGNEILEKQCLIVESLSKMELQHNEKDIFNLIQKLKLNDNLTQVFVWASSKNIQSRILVPFLEHMSNLTVTINSSNHLAILSKSKSGVVKFKEFNHELESGKLLVKDYKKDILQPTVPQETSDDIENLGTFKIGQKADELEAKKKLKLPFEKM